MSSTFAAIGFEIIGPLVNLDEIEEQNLFGSDAISVDEWEFSGSTYFASVYLVFPDFESFFDDALDHFGVWS